MCLPDRSREGADAGEARDCSHGQQNAAILGPAPGWLHKNPSLFPVAPKGHLWGSLFYIVMVTITEMEPS